MSWKHIKWFDVPITGDPDYGQVETWAAEKYWRCNGQDSSKFDANYKVIDLRHSMNLNIRQDKYIGKNTKNCHNKITEYQQQRSSLLIRQRKKKKKRKKERQITRITTDFSLLTLKARRQWNIFSLLKLYLHFFIKWTYYLKRKVK